MKTLRNFSKLIVPLILAFVIASAFSAQMIQYDDSPKANSRYVIKGSEVYDKKTNLTWKRCSVGQHWQEGAECVGVVKTFTFDEAQSLGNGKWRVPTKEELRSLLDHKWEDKHQEPLIDPVSFPNVDVNHLAYWTDISFGAQGWYIRFSDGYVTYSDYRNYDAAVRLVRDGQ